MKQWEKYNVILGFAGLMIMSTSTAPQRSFPWAPENLSIEELASQMIMIAVYPQEDTHRLRGIAHLLERYPIGGIILFRGSVRAYRNTILYLQQKAKIPLLISMDAEWGPAMRLTDGPPALPRAMTLSAVHSPGPIETAGKWAGVFLRALGVHMDLAPVVDVNTEWRNPIIHWRAWSDDPWWTLQKVSPFIRGLQAMRILTCLKHFPGHGPTSDDSHETLPVVPISREQWESIHALPFRTLIWSDSVDAIMMGHIAYPSLQGGKRIPATYSPELIQEILRKRWKFDGLVITDALNMKGAHAVRRTERYIRAVESGADILLFPEDPVEAIETLVFAVRSGRLSRKRLEASVQRIFRVKARLWEEGLLTAPPLPEDSLRRLFHHPLFQAFLTDVAGRSVVVLDRNHRLPIRYPERLRWLVIYPEKMGVPRMLRERFAFYRIQHWDTVSWRELEKSNRVSLPVDSSTVLVLIPPENRLRSHLQNYGLSRKTRHILKTWLPEAHTVILFASPYFLYILDSVTASRTTWVVGWERRSPFWGVTIDVTVGGRPAQGKLPVHLPGWKRGTGKSYPAIRLTPGMPEEAGCNSQKLDPLFSQMHTWIRQKIFPGAQLLIARKGVVFVHRTWGYYTFDSLYPVQDNTLYDLASLTKILSTTFAIMYLYDRGRIASLDQRVCEYLLETCATPLGTLTLRELLTHTSGLPAWYPFFRKISPDTAGWFLCADTSAEFCIPITDSLYGHISLPDSIWQFIFSVSLRNRGKYRYSDLGFLILQRVVERITHMPLDQFVEDSLYARIGVHELVYTPLKKGFSPEQIAPSEVDTYFRFQQIWGTVHDPTCALLGGVCGHAGLFGSARAIAEVMDGFLRGGNWRGIPLISGNVVYEFTRYQSRRHRRGLGFDKPHPRDSRRSPVPPVLTRRTFGHLGFTGTMVWADPGTDNLLIIFLCNSSYPYSWARKLGQANVRWIIVEMVAEACPGNASSGSGSNLEQITERFWEQWEK